jgi:hypothetical protein
MFFTISFVTIASSTIRNLSNFSILIKFSYNYSSFLANWVNFVPDWLYLLLEMKDPYNWNFPQRNETMFMATICIFHHNKKIAFMIVNQWGYRASKTEIYQELNRKGKFLSQFTKNLSYTQHKSSRYRKATRWKVSFYRRIIWGRMI